MNWGTNTTISSGLLISVFSMVVVFLILLIISYIVDLVKVLASRKKETPEKAKKEKATSSVVKTTADDETAMAIAASIALYCGRGIKVKSIKEVGTSKVFGSSIEIK